MHCALTRKRSASHLASHGNKTSTHIGTHDVNSPIFVLVSIEFQIGHFDYALYKKSCCYPPVIAYGREKEQLQRNGANRRAVSLAQTIPSLRCKNITKKGLSRDQYPESISSRLVTAYYSKAGVYATYRKKIIKTPNILAINQRLLDTLDQYLSSSRCAPSTLSTTSSVLASMR